MKEDIIKRARLGRTATERLNFLREELHHLLLQEIDRKDGFKHIRFVGGTALRILYQLDRYSENLDFSAADPENKSFDPESLVGAVRKSVNSYGTACAVKQKKPGTAVYGCYFIFENLLYHVDQRAFRKNQKLAIRFEIDMRPPAGGIEAISPVTGAKVYKVRHYDLPSLFVGKLHAVLFRQYTKGRDLYDLLWYVGRQTPINKVLLENAIEQTQKKRLELTENSLREMLRQKIQATDFEIAKKDVVNFLTTPSSLSLLEPATLLGAVERIILP